VSRLPVRVRLTLAFALAMAVVLAAVGALLYVRLGESLQEQIEDSLETASASVATVVRAGGDPADAQISVEEGFVEVLGPEEPEPSAPLTEEEQQRALGGSELFLTRDVDGTSMRLSVSSVDGRVLVVGASLEDRQEALDGLLTQLFVVGPLALVVTAGAGYFLAGAALRPVEAMRSRAAEVSSERPGTRLPLPAANDEIRRLGETLNEMLARLEAGIARERRFVADASHELRTPLALLRTELELASRRPRSREELEGALVSAREEVERLVRLAEDLLVLARADDGRLPLSTEPHIVREVLDAVAGRYDSRARESGRTLEVSASPEWVLTGDRLRLEQALGNLVDNALRHGAGTVRLEARPVGGSVVLTVSDAGTGFTPEFMPYAFERFSRADVARGAGGAGLGLAIVDAIARAHGGRAQAANRAGGGAEITIVIPAGPDSAPSHRVTVRSA
jgi:two-component system OmpR family sensor kinase